MMMPFGVNGAPQETKMEDELVPVTCMLAGVSSGTVLGGIIK